VPDLDVKCKGCGKRKTFTAPLAKQLGQAIADSGWVIDGSRAECPSCQREVQRSYETVARGRSW
jgi:hypothetical protein